jgi:hypothetical protein
LLTASLDSFRASSTMQWHEVRPPVANCGSNAKLRLWLFD